MNVKGLFALIRPFFDWFVEIQPIGFLVSRMQSLLVIDTLPPLPNPLLLCLEVSLSLAFDTLVIVQLLIAFTAWHLVPVLDVVTMQHLER